MVIDEDDDNDDFFFAPELLKMRIEYNGSYYHRDAGGVRQPLIMPSVKAQQNGAGRVWYTGDQSAGSGAVARCHDDDDEALTAADTGVLQRADHYFRAYAETTATDGVVPPVGVGSPLEQYLIAALVQHLARMYAMAPRDDVWERVRTRFEVFCPSAPAVAEPRIFGWVESGGAYHFTTPAIELSAATSSRLTFTTWPEDDENVAKEYARRIQRMEEENLPWNPIHVAGPMWYVFCLLLPPFVG